MRAWVIISGNGYPIGIRETEQDVISAMHTRVARRLMADSEHKPDEVGLLRWKTEREGDHFRVRFYLVGDPFPYSIMEAFLFDSVAKLETA